MVDKKKEDELGFLKEFLATIDLRVQNIIPGNPPEPDFEVTIGNQLIGIEETGCFRDHKNNRGSISQAIEEHNKKIEELLDNKSASSNVLKGIWGILFFKNKKHPSNKELDQFCNEVIKFAEESICTKIISKKTLDLKPNDKFPLLINYLNLISLLKTNFPTTLWQINRGTNINFTEEQLINVIKPKTEKKHKYSYNNFNKLWLLVVFGVQPSQAVTPSFDIENKLKNFTHLNNVLKSSYFNKVYLFLRRDSIVFEWPGWNKIEPKTS
jgi:hypothetical protein